MASLKPIYKRILLKLSGEALLGDRDFGLDPNVLDRIIGEINTLYKNGVEIGIVVGGGNMYRGATATALGIERITGDQLGMLATVMNALVMRDLMERHGMPTRVMSSIAMTGFVEPFSRLKAISHLQKKRVVIFCSGTGHPLFTTDSTASLRAIEIKADVLLKASHVDGVYTADPAKDPKATRYTHLSYQEALQRQLGIMDINAFMQCHDHNMPLRVFNIQKKGALLRVVSGDEEGTLVER